MLTSRSNISEKNHPYILIERSESLSEQSEQSDIEAIGVVARSHQMKEKR